MRKPGCVLVPKELARALICALAVVLTGPVLGEERTSFTAVEAETAEIPGMPNARFWADAPAQLIRSFWQHQALQIRQSGSAENGNALTWLALSGGGENGAFGAAVLNAWTALGTRPSFTVVSGVSTGALMSPFAFLGPHYDEALRAIYTDVTSADILTRRSWIGAYFGPSFADNTPMRALVARYITPELLAEIADEHRKGRRLLVLTTNLDAQRAVIWDMGAIAASGSSSALRLFQDVLIASGSVPGLFPPVFIEVEANGRRFQEMHVDGGAITQFYAAPAAALLHEGPGRAGTQARLFVLMNMKLDADFHVVEDRTLAIFARSLLTVMKARARGTIRQAYEVARNAGADFNLAYIRGDFGLPEQHVIDQDYMRRLYAYASARTASGDLWMKEPPAFYEFSMHHDPGERR